MTETPPEQESLIEFPCAFPLKIMGNADETFVDAVLEIIRRHDPEFVEEGIKRRFSSGRKYLGLTCTVNAVSRPMLDALYRDLTGHPLIKMVF